MSNRITIQNIANEIGNITAQKNEAYGNSFEAIGPFFKILYPEGIPPSQYEDALLLARIFDKIMRIVTRRDAFGESPYKDIAGYALCGAMKDSRAANAGPIG